MMRLLPPLVLLAKKKEKEKIREGLWKDLPTDLISLISSQLTLLDYVAFRGVCQQWRSASHHSSARIESGDQWPWLILYKYTSSECLLWDSLVPAKTYTIKIPELQCATCIASKEGWLLLHSGKRNLSFLNPFSRVKVDLPEFPVDLPDFPDAEVGDCVGSFSSQPISSDCVAFVIIRKSPDSFGVCTCRRGDAEWTVSGEIPVDTILVVVFEKGRLYCFGEKRKKRMVGILNVLKGSSRLYKVRVMDSRMKRDVLSSPIRKFVSSHFDSSYTASKIYLLMRSAIGDRLIEYLGKTFHLSTCGVSQEDRCRVSGISCIHSSWFRYSFRANEDEEMGEDEEQAIEDEGVEDEEQEMEDEGAEDEEQVMEDGEARPDEEQVNFVQGIWIDPQFVQVPLDHKWPL